MGLSHEATPFLAGPAFRRAKIAAVAQTLVSQTLASHLSHRRLADTFVSCSYLPPCAKVRCVRSSCSYLLTWSISFVF